MEFKNYKDLCRYAHKANIIIAQKFNGKFTLGEIDKYITKLYEKASSESIDNNLKNKYLKVKDYLIFLKDYIHFNYNENEKFALSDNIAVLSGYTEFNFDFNNLRNYYFNNNKNEKIIHILKNKKYFSENECFTFKLSKKRNYKNNFDMEKLNDKKRMIIFEKLNFKRLITCKNTLSDSDFIKLYSYFYQIDVAGLKNLYAHTIYDNPKKYSVDTNGYVTLISKDNRNLYKTDSRSLIVEFYSNKTFKNKVYSLKELANYKYDKKIFVVGSKPGKQIDEDERYLRNKLYGNYPSLKSEVDILLDENCTEQNIEEICKLYPNIIKVLRDSLSDKKIQDDYNEFVKDYNKAIDNLNNYINLVKNNLNEEIELKNE